MPELQIPIVAETAQFWVIDKPVGVAVHDQQGEAGEREPGLLSRLREQLAEPELYLCHRLDRITSGLMLIARGSSANKRLSEAFRQRQIQKYYLAIAAQKPLRKQGLVRGDMGAARNGSWKLLRSVENPAVTQFFSFGLTPGLRLYLLKPHTGKTHQLRVALKSLGVPLLGDTRYGADKSDRAYLHAWQLAFELDGKSYQFRCDPDLGEHFKSGACSQLLEQLAVPETQPWPQV
ncbi:TIGR01621 family pseudouridine synthase [Teredinibacter waterburyi]|jgi:pseudouridine synthase Rlu family protein, TIGR01621|uniref:TIGR01621 family pseudouridine synthase n=1 Tax=Teredinibacter waterburyi TaxID=1500538 RepID=UPI00165F5843|nr:TIGR01621 family pseudouridine synthase [Teredinibacter waterburyi]